MDFPAIAEFIKQVGFPAAIAIFVLWRLDKRLGDLVTELRAFHTLMGNVMSSTSDLTKHVSNEGTRIIREVKEFLHNKP